MGCSFKKKADKRAEQQTREKSNSGHLKTENGGRFSGREPQDIMGHYFTTSKFPGGRNDTPMVSSFGNGKRWDVVPNTPKRPVTFFCLEENKI